MVELPLVSMDVNSRREYARNYMAKRYRTRRGQLLYWLGGQCMDCGARENLYVIRDSRFATDLKTPVTTMLASWSVDRIKKQLATARLVCVRCNYKETDGTQKSA